MSPVKKNFISQVISILIKTLIIFSLIPFYIKYLGQSLYSDWIILLTIPGIFELTNFGINQAVNNTFSIYFNKNDDQSFKIISHGIFLTLIIGIISTSLFLILWDYLNVYSFLNLIEVSFIESRLIIFFLTIKVFLDMIKGILGSYFFAYNLQHNNTNINTAQYLLETIIIVLSVISNISLLNISLLLIVPSLFSCFTLLIINIFRYNYKFTIAFDIKYFKKLLSPSASFSFLTIGQYILNQGFLIVFKKTYSPEALIIFNSSRTIVNYSIKIQSMIASSYYPSFNNFYSKLNYIDLRKAYNKANRINIMGSLITSLILIFMGEFIWFYWIGNSISFNKTLFYLLIVIQFIGSLWLIGSNLIMSINKHFNFSIMFLSSSLISLISLHLFISLVSFEFTPLFFIIHQIVMLIFTYLSIKNLKII